MCGSCGCATTTSTATLADGTAQAYSVSGMTCGHCAASVSTEVGRIDGVTGVEADPGSGRVSVRGSGFTDDAVRAAVAKAGYEVVGT